MPINHNTPRNLLERHPRLAAATAGALTAVALVGCSAEQSSVNTELQAPTSNEQILESINSIDDGPDIDTAVTLAAVEADTPTSITFESVMQDMADEAGVDIRADQGQVTDAVTKEIQAAIVAENGGLQPREGDELLVWVNKYGYFVGNTPDSLESDE